MRDIKRGIEELFSSYKIEYFSSVSVEALSITKPRLLEQLDFVPRSATLFLVPYYVGKTENISLYAAACDYHIFLGEVGGRVAKFLENECGKRAKAFVDHSPLDERHAAAVCALGVIGDNGLLLNEKYGSYVFIGEIISDAPPEELGAAEPVSPLGCSHCGRCASFCPMPDIGECLSALTQKKGTLDEKEREYIKKHKSAWGCDICQSVCPYNKNPKTTPVEFFSEARIPKLTRAILDEMSDEEFAKRAYAWRAKKTILRNIEILEEDENKPLLVQSFSCDNT